MTIRGNTKGHRATPRRYPTRRSTGTAPGRACSLSTAQRRYAVRSRSDRDGQIGSKPTDGDLVAALIHRAVGSVEDTKAIYEEFVKHELAQEGRERELEAARSSDEEES
jgi:hypothetical protein